MDAQAGAVVGILQGVAIGVAARVVEPVPCDNQINLFIQSQ